MGTNRTLNTNERIDNTLSVLKDVTDCLKDITNNPEKTMSQICIEHGINYLNLRRLIESVILCNIYTDKVIDDIKIGSDPYEDLFKSVFCVKDYEVIPHPVDFKDSVDYVIETYLTQREQIVIRLRFGFLYGCALTLEEAGKELDVSKERIRSIEAKALRKLRHYNAARILRDGISAVKLEEEKEKIQKRIYKDEIEKQIKQYEDQYNDKVRDMNKDLIDNISQLVVELKNTNICKLNISSRKLYNALYRARHTTIFDVLILTDEELINIRNLGVKFYKEIRNALDDYLMQNFSISREMFLKFCNEYNIQ